VIVSIDHEAGVVRKSATSPAEAARLANEAAVLGVARHPGVVRLLDFDGRVLTTRWVDGEGALTIEGMGTLATTMADLHAIGVAHRALEPSHVLVAADGRPVLCGFSRAAAGANRAALTADVAALATMLRSQANSGPLAAVLDKAVRRRWPAERLAAALVPIEDVGRATRRRAPGMGQPERRAPWRLVASFVAAAIALTVAVRPSPASPRFELGQSGDQVVFGRWHCEPGRLPALLRRSSGTVWVWDHWPAPGKRSPGRTLTRGQRLTVQPGPPGCDRLIITP
jgi:tRNA A-37 threonylcarbamoyl transferase component Bud32